MGVASDPPDTEKNKIKPALYFFSRARKKKTTD